jgi:hypothetical protein
MLKSETVYKVLYDYIKRTAEEGVDIDKELARWKPETLDIPFHTPQNGLINLCAHLLDDMRKEANKANGKGDIDKAMRAIIKEAKKESWSGQYHGAIIQNGEQYVCDGRRIIHPKTPLDIPAAPDTCKNDMAEAIRGARGDAGLRLDLPSIASLKAFIKVKTAERQYTGGRKTKPIEYDFGEGLPMVNAQYLLDILTAFPDATAYTGDSTTHMVYFTASEGEAALCPIRKREAAAA